MNTVEWIVCIGALLELATIYVALRFAEQMDEARRREAHWQGIARGRLEVLNSLVTPPPSPSVRRVCMEAGGLLQITQNGKP